MKSRKIFEAIEFAAAAHAGQFRKGTEVPYIVHPLSVGKILIEHGCDEETVVAGILHDTVEDTEVTIDQVREKFGKIVANLVEAASEPDKSDTWENRKQHTVEHLKAASPAALLVEVSDKLDNIHNIRDGYARWGEKIWARFTRSKEFQCWYYRALSEAFGSRVNGEPLATLVAEFQAEVVEVFGRPGTDSTKSC